MEHIFSSKHRQFVGSRLRFRIIIFLILGFFLLGLMLYDVLIGQVTWWVAIAALAVGLVVGYIFGRLTRVIWHESREQVVIQADLLYFVLIAAYIGVSYARETVLRDFLSGAALLAVSYAIGSGILLGRFAGVHHSILRVLKTNKP